MILRAAWVAPVAAPLISDGFVEIDEGRIAAVGHWAERPRGAADATDLGEALLTPGLVNCHTHLELTCYAGKLRPAPLCDWISGLIELRRAPGQVERETQAVRDGARLSLRAGVTCVGDISRRNLTWRALRDVPIRRVCFVELLTLADDPPRDPDELGAALADVNEGELTTAGVAPHAPYSVPQEQIAAAVALAGRRGRPWTMHLAETREEVRFLKGERGALPAFLESLTARRGVAAPRCGPIELLRRVAGAGPRGLLAHLNYLSDDDVAAFAASGHCAVYCPRAHAFFGHATHPFAKLRAAGATVAIGTDSLASNASLSLLEELRFVRQRGAPPDVALSCSALLDAAALLRSVTLDAARGLGLETRIGSLEPGKAADLAAFPVPRAARDPVAEVIDAAPPAAHVWVAGREVRERA